MKSILVTSRLAMGIAILMQGLWLMFAHMTLGYWNSWIVKIETVVFAAFAISLALSKRYPWLPVLVSWLDILMIITRTVPWNPNGAGSFGHQFMGDLIFLFSAHISLFAQYKLNRTHQSKAA